MDKPQHFLFSNLGANLKRKPRPTTDVTISTLAVTVSALLREPKSLLESKRSKRPFGMKHQARSLKVLSSQIILCGSSLLID